MRNGIFISLSLLLSGCATHHHSTTSVQIPPISPESYVRISNRDSNIVELQIAIRKFVPPHRHGPIVWLTGVSHIGESNYFYTLQRHLNAQSLLLFQGMGDPS